MKTPQEWEPSFHRSRWCSSRGPCCLWLSLWDFACRSPIGPVSSGADLSMAVGVSMPWLLDKVAENGVVAATGFAVVATTAKEHHWLAACRAPFSHGLCGPSNGGATRGTWPKRSLGQIEAILRYSSSPAGNNRNKSNNHNNCCALHPPQKNKGGGIDAHFCKRFRNINDTFQEFGAQKPGTIKSSVLKNMGNMGVNKMMSLETSICRIFSPTKTWQDTYFTEKIDAFNETLLGYALHRKILRNARKKPHF